MAIIITPPCMILPKRALLLPITWREPMDWKKLIRVGFDEFPLHNSRGFRREAYATLKMHVSEWCDEVLESPYRLGAVEGGVYVVETILGGSGTHVPAEYGKKYLSPRLKHYIEFETDRDMILFELMWLK